MGSLVTLEMGKGLQVFTYARHLWVLSDEGSLACHTYCDRTSAYNGHLLGPVALTPLPSVWQCSCPACFYDLVLSRLGSELPTFRLRGEHSNLSYRKSIQVGRKQNLSYNFQLFIIGGHSFAVSHISF